MRESNCFIPSHIRFQMHIYLICPVRLSTPEIRRASDDYVASTEASGHTIFYPPRDVDQKNITVEQIVAAEIDAIRTADEVHVFWDINSRGSHFDLGVALGLGKPVQLIHSYDPDPHGRGYERVIRAYEQKHE